MSVLALLDNTVLSNFALIRQASLVFNIWGDACATTLAVMAEYQVGVAKGILPQHIWRNLSLLELNEVERNFADSLSTRLGVGERTCLAVSVYRDGLFVSDDLAARHIAQANKVATTGTVGILAANVRQDYLLLDQANAFLSDLISLGYRSPVTALDDLLM